ncbi:MAG: ferredoxin [Acidimicrobiaceae bacterium]|nr:ferredoxin [Acidimicrobiaceae bacterium]
MKIRVDRAKCEGHAVCHSQAPDVYPLDELGYNAVDGVLEVGPADADAAERGARGCPERAIVILDEGSEP